MAIDREEINQTLFYGTAKMGAMSPMPASKYYKPEYGTAWAKYDKAAANKLLDEMGLKKGADGMRTRKDGTPLKYNIENCRHPGGSSCGKILRNDRFLLA